MGRHMRAARMRRTLKAAEVRTLRRAFAANHAGFDAMRAGDVVTQRASVAVVDRLIRTIKLLRARAERMVP